MTDLGKLRKRAEAAANRFKEGKAELYRADGTPWYSEDAHRERLEELAVERDEALDRIIETATGERVTAEGEAERMRHAGPASFLTDEELARANARRAFALDAAESLNPRDLVRRLEGVIAAGDRANAFAYWSAAQKVRRGMNDAVGGDHTELAGALEKLRAFLQGESRRAVAEQSDARAREAMGLEILAGSLKRGARNAAGAYANERYGEDRGRYQAV